VRERAHMSHSLQFAEKDAVHGLAGLLYWLGNLDKKISARGFINAQSGTATYRALRVVELLGNGWIWLPLPVVVVMFSPRAALRHRALLLSLAVGFIFDIICLGIIKVREHVQRRRGSHSHLLTSRNGVCIVLSCRHVLRPSSAALAPNTTLLTVCTF